MQVSTYTQMAVPLRSAVQTRSRLIAAAAEIFSREGVQGATTREIARTAGVNEVTLFRHFAHKEQLLAEVVAHSLALQSEALDHPSEWTHDLRTDLGNYARMYNRMLEQHAAIIRTFIGEAGRHPDASRHIVLEAARVLRERLIAYLVHLQEAGRVRIDVDPAIAIDQLTGLLLAGMLRRSFRESDYSTEQYLDTCIDLIVRGIGTD